MNITDDIGGIISEALLQGESRDEIVSKLDKMIEAGGVTLAEIDLFIKIWNRSAIEEKNYNNLSAWAKVNERILNASIKGSARLQLKRYLTGAAASLILIIGAAWMFNFVFLTQSLTTVSTPSGDRATIMLPDGTSVKLNAATTLCYSQSFFSNKRLVEFSGEGFFEVAKKAQPFQIKMKNGLTLTVLGTTFNLSAYQEDEIFKAALVEGRIELTNENDDRVIVTPGNVASFNTLTGKITVEKSDVNHEKGWLQRKIYLDNMSISQLCQMLERNFSVKINLDSNVVASNICYTGVLQENSIEEVLVAMKQLSHIRYEIDGNQINIALAK